MRQYELMIILDSDLEERTVAPSLERYLTVIREAGGTIDNVDVWGKRRMAYPINKKNEGIYAVVTMKTEPAAALELDRQLNLNESIVRTKLIRPDAR
ncbi:30S ribosomal protein S6 [Actinosynnema sp.]|uniref:30S ribosomal protein S6 n=1 Tax=Actinosynnema sp. TaxID=1872144 RepID=UPI003F8382A2